MLGFSHKCALLAKLHLRLTSWRIKIQAQCPPALSRAFASFDRQCLNFSIANPAFVTADRSTLLTQQWRHCRRVLSHPHRIDDRSRTIPASGSDRMSATVGVCYANRSVAKLSFPHRKPIWSRDLGTHHITIEAVFSICSTKSELQTHCGSLIDAILRQRDRRALSRPLNAPAAVARHSA